MNITKAAPLALTALLALGCLLSHSCANTTTAPSGGPKDTIPPVLLKVTPENNATGFKRTGGTVQMLFNEYTVVKTATDIYLSPPVKKKPTSKLKGKNLVITLQDTLRENQTYTLDFGQALADNNEGNLAPRYVYTFSTGDTIDSLYCTGSVIDCKTLKPVKGALVALYADQSDSACFLSFPDAASKTDDWGFFSIRNIKQQPYRVYAYTDKDGDSKYNPTDDQIAFLDSLYTPTAVVNDSIYELGSFIMKDTLACKGRNAMMKLNLFTELQDVQYLKNYGRKSEKQGFFKFSASDVQINSLKFLGFKEEDVVLQYNLTRDSIDFWITSKYRIQDSLMVMMDYMKTDSTGKLSPCTENLSMAVMKSEASGDDKSRNSGKGKDDKSKGAKDTVFKFTVTVTPENVELDGVSIACEFPVIKMTADSIRLYETNPKNQIAEKKLAFKRDSTDIRKFILSPVDKMLQGYKYKITIPQGTFINMYNLPNALEDIEFALPQSEKLSSITLNIQNVEGRYIVELTDEKGTKTFRTYTIDHDCKLFFPYLTGGEKSAYAVRITEDKNGNGIYDTGNLLSKRQPEMVLNYEFSHDVFSLPLPEMTELEQDIDIRKMFAR